MATKAPSLSNNPLVLYRASIEHVDALTALRDAGRWLLAIYVSGLAVECILQAIALHRGASHDARHDLRMWLSKCPQNLQATIDAELAEPWSRLTIVWINPIRYLSHAGLLGRLRQLRLDRKIKGDMDSVLKVNADRVIAAARIVHAKGVNTWQQVYSEK